MLVFDTETRTDATQRLTFGSYRFMVAGECREEALFCADDLAPRERHILEAYAMNEKVVLLSLRHFLEMFYKAVYKGRCLLVAFNMPFDMSRIAYDVKSARRRFEGGFSLGLWSYIDKAGQIRNHQFRPRFGCKHIDSKRALKGFTARNNPDLVDLIPEGSTTGKPEEAYKFPGHFVDLRTLAFALTDRSYTLESACEDFGVEHGKIPVNRHGIVTPEYIAYNRRDVLATWELAIKLLEEYDRHPIRLWVTKAYSPASMGKGYLREMAIRPALERQPDFPREYLGYPQSGFLGGRTSAHIRKVPAPVVYTDFLSMYPTVNSLMGLWRFVIAERIEVVEHCQDEIEMFLRQLKPDDLFKPGTWRQLPAFVRIIPNGDILPCRAKYSRESNDWQVGVNHLYAGSESPDDALWFSLPDVVASVILTGRIPKIVDAFRIKPHGKVPNLRPIKLRWAIPVDPASEDFFKVVIEQRKLLDSRSDLSRSEKDRLGKALKVLANSASYGIYAEMNRQESERGVLVKCHGIDAEPFTCRVAHPDVPGEFCFPPLASLITGAARLMLALLEHCVTELGGTYAMEDTDSMAIVATERGGLIPCPGGPYRTPDGQQAVKALWWKQVDQIADRFAALNPYDRNAVPGSILKIEKDNYDPATGKQRQIYCVAISAKRYALFLFDETGRPVLLRKGINNGEDRWSEHGLGHLLNPIDPENPDRAWIAQAWENIVRRALNLPTLKPSFADSPAVGRITVSSPAVMRPLTQLNKRKPYSKQIKPFNFLLTCHVLKFGYPPEADLEHFHLIAPYENDPTKWLRMDWIDQYSGQRYRITTAGSHGSRRVARVKTYGDVLEEYEFHPESKCADAEDKPCGKQTVGLLQRRHIRVDQIKYIGKESNSLEEVESGLIHSEQNVYTEYPDQRRDTWETHTKPELQRFPLTVLVRATAGQFSRRTLIDWRSGRSRPHSSNEQVITKIIQLLLKHRTN
jgi:hypothetical protein